jgi:hypothetical protein
MIIRNLIPIVSLAILIIACVATPVHADDIQYTGGSPDLTANISGINEFTAGSDIVIPIELRNNGLSASKEVIDGVTKVTPLDSPTTAKFVTVNLSSGNAPVAIKSSSQMIGDIPGQGTAAVRFSATINADAPAGTYLLPVEIAYSTQSAHSYDREKSSVKNYYEQHSVSMTVPLVIKKEVLPEVISAVPHNLVAGADGTIDVTVRNVGSLDGRKSTIRLVQISQSPVSPIDNGVYVGDFSANGTVSGQFKVTVDKTAVNKQYPVGVMVVYQNHEGDFVNSRIIETGVDVGNKVDFAILSPLITLSPGSTETIHVEYKNTGDTVIRGAEARLNAGKPFEISGNGAYLGDLEPGQSAVAEYEIEVAPDAVTKLYGIDSQVRYRDTLDKVHVSDILKVPVDVKTPTGIAGILSNKIYVTIIIAAILGIVYAIWYFGRKGQ